jgi:hypothetical protein
MKKALLALVIVLAFGTFAIAQMGGGQGMMGQSQQSPEGQQYQPQQQWGPGWCPGPGMMGPGYGYGMGPGMMGPGYGYGMGPGMMGPGYGYGMGPGMMGPGYGPGGQGYGFTPEMQKFFDDTKDLRRQLIIKQQDYFDAARNPKTTPDELKKLQEEIQSLQGKIHEKAPRGY